MTAKDRYTREVFERFANIPPEQLFREDKVVTGSCYLCGRPDVTVRNGRLQPHRTQRANVHSSYCAGYDLPPTETEPITVVSIDGAGAGRCYVCNGQLDYSWVVRFSNGQSVTRCSNDLPAR